MRKPRFNALAFYDEARALGVQFRVNFRADGGSIDDITIPDAVPVEEQKRLRKVIEANKRELVSFAGPSGIPCRCEGVAQVVVHDDWIAAIEEREREDKRRRRRQARDARRRAHAQPKHGQRKGRLRRKPQTTQQRICAISDVPKNGDPRYRDPDWLASAAAELGVSVEEVKRRLDFLEKKQIEWSMTDAEWESFMDCWAEVEAEAKAFGLDFETYVPLAAKEGKA